MKRLLILSVTILLALGFCTTVFCQESPKQWLTIELFWDQPVDLDLWVRLPTGAWIGYTNPVHQGAVLLKESYGSGAPLHSNYKKESNGPDNELVYVPVQDSYSEGEYIVAVALYSNYQLCTHAEFTCKITLTEVIEFLVGLEKRSMSREVSKIEKATYVKRFVWVNKSANLTEDNYALTFMLKEGQLWVRSGEILLND